MALFKIEKGLATNLLANRPNAVEGYCYFTTDDGKFYIDTKTGSLTGSNPTGTRVALNANYASKLLFGEITQSSSSTLKVSTVNNLSSLVHGTIVVLKNNGSNTAANANLNINNLGSKPIYVNGNPITANTWRANEMAILFYDANSYSGTTGVWSLIPGVTYIHPQYTARTGVPTANQTPAFGGTFSVNQITSDSTGHVTAATSRTITIPSTLSNGTGTAGLIKTSSTVTSNSGYTACPVINGVPYYKDTNTTYTLGSFGITATAAELNYSSGLTGNIQTQLNNKSSSTHTHNYAGSSSAGGPATSVAYEEGTSNQSRHVWFSHASSQGKLVYNNDFKYNPSTNVLTVGSITGTAAKATSDGSGNNIVNTYATKTALKSVSDLVGSTSVATQISNALTTANTYTNNKVASLVDSAPETLNTLNELAAALGDDANFSTTVLNQIGTKANANHTHNYAGSSSAGGSANSAVKLDSSAGSATQPIYFSNGKPTACTYTLGKSVPSNAVFTDTVYTHPITSGNKHIPSGGSSGQILRWSSDGTAVWGSDSDTKNTAGSTDTSSKIFLIGATSQAANPQTYSHNTAFVGTDGCLYSNNTKVSVNGHTHNYITISDTRNDNPAPNSASFIKQALSADFKYVNKINSPSGFGGNYCGLINFAPWSETSGGNGYQIAVGYNTNAHPRLAVRSADLSATSWGSWYKIYTSDDKPTPADIGAAASSHTHTVANITNLTATATELNYCDGVTSNIQTQLNGKASSSHNHSASNITAGTLGGKVVANTSAVSDLIRKQLRNITISTALPTSSDGENGDIWLVY